MTGACPAIVDGDFLQSMLAFVDCQAQTIGARGYLALAAAGSPLSMLLTGLLTLFVAFFGYRMLFGETPGTRDIIVAVAKIGIVLALTTSWGAYRTLVYDVVFQAPTELFAGVAEPAGLPGAGGGLVDRLAQVDSGLIRLGRLGAGSNASATRIRAIDGQEVLVTEAVSEPPSLFTPFALGTARLVFLVATVASFATVRLIAGLLLAIGPFFIAFLLFEGTRSLFEGWIHGLIAAAVGALATTLLLAVELALLEPWVATLIARRLANLPIGGAATELLVVMSAFALVLIGGLGMAARLARFRLPAAWRSAPAQLASALDGGGRIAQASAERHGPEPAEQLSRAAAVAEAVAHVQRRESHAASGLGAPSRAASVAPARDISAGGPSPLGQSYRRTTRGRISASAGRRDSRA